VSEDLDDFAERIASLDDDAVGSDIVAEVVQLRDAMESLGPAVRASQLQSLANLSRDLRARVDRLRQAVER
jgi:hypothetical protein